MTIPNSKELTGYLNELIKKAYLDGLNSGIEAEREACAKFVNEYYGAWANTLADAIRNRSNT
jgi:hypothetical protein